MSDPIVRNAQEKRQLDLIGAYLRNKGYSQKQHPSNKSLTEMEGGTFALRMNVTVGDAKKIKIPIDVVVQPKTLRPSLLPILIEAKSAGDFTNVNKRRKEEAKKMAQLKAQFGDQVEFVLLKEYLTRRVRLLHLHRFSPSDVQFNDALVSSALVVFEKEKPNDHEVVFSFGGSLSKPAQSVLVRHGSFDPSDKWTQYIRKGSHDAARTVADILFGDLFNIRRGLATGNNRFFILPRAEAARLGLPEAFLKPILPPPRHLPNRVIESDPDGFPRLDSQFVLLDCSLAEAEIERHHAELWRYLEAGMQKGIHQSYLTSRRSPWYSQEDRPPPPFLCTYMGRNQNGRKPFRFLWNKSQATAHNVFLLLYPKGILREVLTLDPSLYATVFAALQSLDTETITGNGRVYGGGLYKLEPKELANIPADFLVKPLDLARSVKVYHQRDLFATPDSI